MLLNSLGELVLVALTVLFALLVLLVFKSKRPLLKWGGAALAALPTLLFGLLSVVIGIGLFKLYAPLNVPVPDVKVAGTPEQIARGENLANAVCAGCHAPNGNVPLIGGLDLGQDSLAPVGNIVSLNLTLAGELKDWSDGEIMRALRNGAHKNGRPLLMPINHLRNLSDDDMQSVIAYLCSQPAVQNPMPPTNPSLVLALFVGAGLAQMPLDLTPIQGAVVAPPKAASPEYGAYLISFQDCRDCHDANLQGRSTAGLYPVSPPVLPYIRAWSQDAFIQTMRTGVAPSGYRIKGVMATQARQLGKFDDIELAAMYQYLRSLK